MRLDKTLIRTKGKEAIGRFLQALQVYKATADVERGTKFFKRYL
jgi:dipeptidyl-peptidase-3